MIMTTASMNLYNIMFKYWQFYQSHFSSLSEYETERTRNTSHSNDKEIVGNLRIQ